MKKITLFILAIVLVSGLGLAAWLLSFQGHAIYQITSDGELQVITDFSGGSLKANDTINNLTDIFIVDNKNNNLNLKFDISETRTDVSDSCANYSGDCILNYKLNGISISDGETGLIKSGLNNVSVLLDCKKFSCPQAIEVNISAS